MQISLMWVTAMNVDKAMDFRKSARSLNSSGGWIYTMASELVEKDDITQLTVVSVNDQCEDFETVSGKVRVVGISAKNTGVFGRRSVNEKLIAIAERVKPDIVDIQGVEFIFSGVQLPCSTVHTIQGLPFELYKYQRMQPLHIAALTGASLKGVLGLRCFATQNLYMRIRGRFSKSIMLRGGNFIGRTSWDAAICRYTNRASQYYTVNRVLREAFYQQSWDADKAQKHALFTIGFSTINKGFDILLRAFRLVLDCYPDAKLYVPGSLKTSWIGGKWYDRYIHSELVRLGLLSNVVFLGSLNSEQMVSYLKSCHVFVSPSLNENSSNAIGEAQLVGIPVVATYTGGNTSYIKDQSTGLLYNPWDEYMCANCISTYFEDKALCRSVSQQERAVAQKRHCRQRAVEELLSAYRDILQKHTDRLADNREMRIFR